MNITLCDNCNTETYLDFHYCERCGIINENFKQQDSLSHPVLRRQINVQCSSCKNNSSSHDNKYCGKCGELF